MMCINGPMDGYQCDEPPGGYQSMRLKPHPTDDDQDDVLVFIHAATFDPNSKRQCEKALQRVRDSKKRGPL